MIKVGVSACVMGEKVRFDGGHKRSGYVAQYLAEVFEMQPVCPEVGIGMPVPRPAIRVVESEGGKHALRDSKDNSIDYTEKLDAFYAKKSAQIAHLDGFIFCGKSPTCGTERIKVYDDKGNLQHRKGIGMFAQQVKEQYPHLPIEEDGRLNDQGLRESFITKVYVHHRFRKEVAENPTIASLVSFHSSHKFLVMAYSPQAYQSLGRLVAKAKDEGIESTMEQYMTIIMKTLSKPTNRKKHTNVLMHLQGFFKKQLSKEDKQELSEQIDKYRLGYVPLLAPVTLLQHHLKNFPNDYLKQQVYLAPFPEQLGLRA